MLKQSETFDLISGLYYTTLLKRIEKQKIIEKQNTSDVRASSANLASDGQASVDPGSGLRHRTHHYKILPKLLLKI